jgi:hypothetical protein
MMDHVAFKILHKYVTLTDLEDHDIDNVLMMKELLATVFNDWDVHEVGYIEKQTFVHVIHTLGLHFTTQQMNCMFRAIDPDLNGKIVFDEFWEILVEPLTKAIELLKSHFEFKKAHDDIHFNETTAVLNSLYPNGKEAGQSPVQYPHTSSPLSPYNQLKRDSHNSSCTTNNSSMHESIREEEEDDFDHENENGDDMKQHTNESVPREAPRKSSSSAKLFNRPSERESTGGGDAVVLDTSTEDWSTSIFGVESSSSNNGGGDDSGSGVGVLSVEDVTLQHKNASIMGSNLTASQPMISVMHGERRATTGSAKQEEGPPDASLSSPVISMSQKQVPNNTMEERRSLPLPEIDPLPRVVTPMKKRRPQKRTTLSPSGSGKELNCTGSYKTVEEFFAHMTPTAPSGSGYSSCGF